MNNMDQHPLIDLHPVLVHLVSLPAVALASYRALNNWRAVRALHLHPASITKQPAPPPTPKVATPWRAHFTKPKMLKSAIGLAIFSVIYSLEMFLIFGLPRVSSQMVFDGVWSAFMAVFLTFTFTYTIDNVFPVSKTAQWHRRIPNAPLTLSILPAGDRQAASKVFKLRLGIAFVAAVAVLVSASFGITAHHALVGAAIVIPCLSTMHFPTMSVRKTILLMLGPMTLLPALSLALTLIMEQFSGDSDDSVPEDTAPKLTVTSDWLSSVMFVYANIFSVIVPGIITAMTLRFEYTISTDEPARPVDAAPDAPVVVPTDFVTFRQPIFISSLVSLFTGLTVVQAIGYLVPEVEWLPAMPLAIYITVPIVVCGTALAALVDGKLSAWWKYTEVWIPQSNDASNAEEGVVKSAEEQGLLTAESKEEVE